MSPSIEGTDWKAILASVLVLSSLLQVERNDVTLVNLIQRCISSVQTHNCQVLQYIS